MSTIRRFGFPRGSPEDMVMNYLIHAIIAAEARFGKCRVTNELAYQIVRASGDVHHRVSVSIDVASEVGEWIAQRFADLTLHLLRSISVDSEGSVPSEPTEACVPLPEGFDKGRVLRIEFDEPVKFKAGETYSISITRDEGKNETP